jgi:hypothetical protein
MEESAIHTASSLLALPAPHMASIQYKRPHLYIWANDMRSPIFALSHTACDVDPYEGRLRAQATCRTAIAPRHAVKGAATAAAIMLRALRACAGGMDR